MEGPRLWLALLALTVITRLPALLYPRAIDDEAVYAVVAKVMLAGGMPYRDAIERKPPLLFGVYWAIFRLFGSDNWLALHLVAVAWVLVTMVGLFVMAQRLAGPRAGALAALGYALVQPFATAKNLAFNGELLMNLPLVWAYALALPGSPQRRFAPAVAGALLAIAFLLKQPALIAALPIGVYLLGAPLWRKDIGWSRAIAQAAALVAGFALVAGGAALLLWRYGLLGETWYWTFTDHKVPHIFWQHGLAHSALFLVMALPLAMPLIAWQPLRRAWRGREAELAAVLGWLAVSVIGAAAGGRFYPHYYIQIIPPLAVLASVAYARVDEVAGVPRGRWVAPGLACLWLTLAALVSLGVASVQLLGERTPSAAASYVAAQAKPADRLFVWGQQTCFYLDAGLLPASRYIATFPLTGYIFGGAMPGVSTRDRIVPGAWNTLAADFRRRPPAFIIDTQSSPGAAYPIADFPFLAQLVASKYQRVTAFADGTVYRRRNGL